LKHFWLTLLLHYYPRGNRGSRFFYKRLSVCLFLTISKKRCRQERNTNAQMFHSESSKPSSCGVKKSKVKVTSHKNIAVFDSDPFASLCENMTSSTKPEVLKYRKFGEIWACGYWDMRADRQTDRQTDRPTDTLIAIPRTCTRGEIAILCGMTYNFYLCMPLILESDINYLNLTHSIYNYCSYICCVWCVKNPIFRPVIHAIGLSWNF